MNQCDMYNQAYVNVPGGHYHSNKVVDGHMLQTIISIACYELIAKCDIFEQNVWV